MAYISGRTVKSNKAKRSPIEEATAAARKLARAYLPTTDGVTVDSVRSADPTTLAPLIRTTITFPETLDAADLACAAQVAPGVVSTSWTTVSVTITREA